MYRHRPRHTANGSILVLDGFIRMTCAASVFGPLMYPSHQATVCQPRLFLCLCPAAWTCPSSFARVHYRPQYRVWLTHQNLVLSQLSKMLIITVYRTLLGYPLPSAQREGPNSCYVDEIQVSRFGGLRRASFQGKLDPQIRILL